MASGSQNMTTYKAKQLVNTYGSDTKPVYINAGVPTILGTIGGQYNPVWINNGVVTAITAGTTGQFYRGDKTWSNTLTDRIHLNGTRKLQWTTDDNDNNSDGASWYGLGAFGVSEENTTRSWICLSNYWGLSFRARDNSHVKINGNIALHAGNYNDYAPKKDGTGANGDWNINAASATLIRGITKIDTTALTYHPGTKMIGYVANVYAGTTGLFPNSNNANGILVISRHEGATHTTSLGFSSNGNMYYKFGTPDTSGGWKRFCMTDGDGASGTWGISITGDCNNAKSTWTGSCSPGSIGNALKTFWDNNKTTMPRNRLIAFNSDHSGRAMHMGYFIDGWDTAPWGGFFTAFYGTPYYTWVEQGTFNQKELIRNDGRTYGISISGNAATSSSCSGNAATATNADKTDGFHLGSGGIPFANSYSYNQPTSGAVWYLKISTGAWNSSPEVIWISCSGSNKYGNVILFVGSRQGYWWGYATSYNFIGISGVTVGISNSNDTYIRLTSDCTSCTIRTSYGATISATSASSYTTVDTGIFGNHARFETIHSSTTYGAVWNDIAECRQSKIQEPGRVITPTGELTQERLVPGARIISDTYGYLLGTDETKQKIPVGIAGRVLAYPYKSLDYYKVGDTVCSAPNGTIDTMTRKEIQEYPDCILGIINEIPQSGLWEPSQVSDRDPIYINGRIWIDIK